MSTARAINRTVTVFIFSLTVLASIVPATAQAGGFWTSTRSAGLADGFLFGADFVDASNGWVVGQFEHSGNNTLDTTATPIIEHTSDAGATWKRQDGDLNLSSAFLISVDFVDANNGWAVGRTGKGVDPNDNWGALLLHTADGGKTWQRQQVPFTKAGALWSVQAIDANQAWVVGTHPNESSFVLHTVDGGATWVELSSLASQGELYGIAFVDTLRGWVVGWEEPPGEPVIYSTADGGVSWSRKAFPQYNQGNLHAVTFVDANNGWAVGREDNWLRRVAPPLILRTTDGGATWAQQQVAHPNADLRSVVFPDLNNGWAVGIKGGDTSIPYVVHTEDGGTTWTEETVGAESALLQSVTFDKQGNGWAVGYTPAASSSPAQVAAKKPRGVVLRHHARDRKRPRTVARPARSQRGQIARLRYRIIDPAPSVGFAKGQIVITSNGRVVEKLSLGRVRTNRTLKRRFRVHLKAKRYRYFAKVTDIAGNSSRRMTSATLDVS